jgi:anaerobic magnesium-protoporphyrin IX monomethyl ester cyclase
MACVTLSRATEVARSLPDNIEGAVAVMRDRSGKRFFDPVSLRNSGGGPRKRTRDDQHRLYPLVLDFSAYRTPFSLLDIREIQKDARPEQIHFMRIFPRITPEGCFPFSMDKTRTSGVRRFRI